LAVFTYIAASFYFAFKIVPQKKDFKVFFLVPVAFATRHIGYGLGSLSGLIDFLFKKHGRKKTKGN
jgi:hypothetical protein